MINKFLPEQLDNTYRGHKLALWFFGVVVFMKALQGLSVIYDSYSMASSADGIPIETFPTAAAQTVATLFAISGFFRLIISLLAMLVFIRYRSAIAFMFSLLALDYVGRQIILRFYPLVRVGNPVGPNVSHILFALTIVGLVLSLWKMRTPQGQVI